MQQKSMERFTSKDKYLRKAQKQQSCFGKGKYQLRFPTLKDSFLNKCCCYTFCLALKAFSTTKNQGIPKDQKQLQQLLPINFNPKFEIFSNKINYTWIGHSTAVISIGNHATIMIDPVFSERASPFTFIGPKRFRKPACEIKNLPDIDAIFISHDHYDHLDTQSLNQIQQRFQPKFFIGMDSSDVLPKDGDINQLDWAQTRQYKIKNETFKITFVPVCHWSKRWLCDTQQRLWGGFVIQTPRKKKIFYAGDTGYCQIFKQIGQQFGQIDLAILPIGAYHPRQFLSNQHIDPQQAVIVHKQLNSKKSIGVHWGTFPLGFQHYAGARQQLKQAKIKHGLKENDFITIQHGGNFTIDY